MSGRAATINVIPGDYALAVGQADMPTPKGWQWVALTDVARLESGHTPSRESPEYWDGGIPWMGIRDARTHHGGIISTTLQTVTQAGLDNSAARLLPENTVCLSRTASVGYVVVMGREMATSQDFVNWICSPVLDPHFLKQLFLAEAGSLLRFSKGTTHSTIYYPEVKAFRICLPPLNEQKRIVAKIEELTDRSRRAKEAMDGVPPLLDQLRQSILAAAFRGDLTADWRAKNPDVEPADTLLAHIRAARRARAKGKGMVHETVESASSFEEELPRGWKVGTIGELCIIASGQTPKGIEKLLRSGQELPWFRVADMNIPANRVAMVEAPNTLSANEAKAMGLHARPAGTIIFPKRGGAIATNKKRLLTRPSAYDLNIMGLICPPALQAYLFRWFGTVNLALLNDGSTIPQINNGDIEPLRVPIPSIAEQETIVRTIDHVFALLNKVVEQVLVQRQNLDALEHSILAKAFRGELVPQDPTDEPASVLLDRIRAARTTEPPTKRPRKTRSPAPPEPKPEPAAIRVPTQPQLLLDPATLQEQVVTALWPLGPLDKDTAIRKAAESLRTAGHVDFQRLRADGPLYTQILTAIRSAVKTGQLDRPTRGYVRACKPDALAYTPDDWRHALVASLGPEPIDREQAIRNAAQWAREQLGLEFSRLRADGHIAEGLRSAITSAIRRGEIIGHAKRISRPV